MRTYTWIASIVTGSVLLTGPITTFAATGMVEPATDADAVSEEEILRILEEPAPQSLDGRGGGYGILPSAYGGGVQIDASVTDQVTPDYVALNAYCSSGRVASREAARDALDALYENIRNAVGNDGRVRRSGGIPVYPVYGPRGEETDGFTADMNILIRIVNVSAAQRISDAVEDNGCGVNWDVRLVDTHASELSLIDELTDRMNNRKEIFERILSRELDKVIAATMYTWVDGYGTYDPEANTVDGTTTLSVSYSLEDETPAPARRSTGSSRLAPRG